MKTSIVLFTLIFTIIAGPSSGIDSEVVEITTAEINTGLMSTAYDLGLISEILTSTFSAECININQNFEGENIMLLYHPCCPCANEHYQCGIGGGNPEECWDNFEDCLDDLYGPE